MPRTTARARSPRSLQVSEAFRAFVLDQLEGLGEVTARSMFGGVGLYRGGVFFGILAHDRAYFKTGPANRRDYTRANMPAFRPYPDRAERSTRYYAVPLDVLESAPELEVWARKAIEAALSARTRKKARPLSRSGPRK